MIEQRFAVMMGRATPAPDLFNIEDAVSRLDDPTEVMRQWMQHEGRDFPEDYGVVFFRGWESFTPEQKIEAVRDAKRVLDRTLSK